MAIVRGCSQPPLFAPQHPGPLGGGLVGGTGEMMITVGHVEGQFTVYAGARRAFIKRALHIHDNLSGVRMHGAGQGVIGKTYHVGRAGLIEGRLVHRRNAFVVRKDERQFAI